MGQRVSLTSEMNHYITTGTCPRCDAVILSPDYVRQKRQAMFTQARKHLNMLPPIRTWLSGDPLIPAGAKVQYNGGIGMKCLTCMNTWNFNPPLGMPLPSMRHTAVDPASGRAAVTNRTTPSLRATAPIPVTNINVANYQLIDIKDEQRIETVLYEEKRKLENPSGAKVTRRAGIVNSVTRTVTIDTNNIKTSGTQTGAQILGFATIQGQVQEQLGQRHAREDQGTLSINEEIEVALDPYQAIELTITWKLVQLNAKALLGLHTIPSVEVPDPTRFRSG
jgi:hypothetical protein